MRSLLVTVLRQTFNEKAGKFQVRQEQPKALLVSFDTHINYETEEGYRYLDLLVYGPMNYVQVWVRERWNVIPVEDLNYDDLGDASVKPGKDYQEGAGEWRLAADHDSCWPDGIDRVLRAYEDRIATFSGMSFYEVVEVEKQGLPDKAEAVRYQEPEA